MGITLRDEHDWFMQQLFTEVLMGMAPKGRALYLGSRVAAQPSPTPINEV